MKHLLILNCFLDKGFSQDFNESIDLSLMKTECKISNIQASDLLSPFETSFYTHLLISGSLASAYQNQPWNSHVENLIRQFINEKKPVLGICYGHQFLARTLAGVQHVRRAENSEFGWAYITIKKHPLFKNMSSIISFVSHFDEVVELNSDFTIIASTELCPVHGFQYKDLPVFGLQFHPEYGKEKGEIILQNAIKTDAELIHHLINHNPTETQLNKNKDIFVNFVNMS